MAGLKNTTISGGYQSIIRVDDNSGIGGSAIQCTDGEGNKAPFKVSNNLLQAQPSDTDGNAFEVNTSGGSNRFRVNTSTPYVTALGNHVNTQYAYFGINYIDLSNIAAAKHFPIPFSAASGGAALTNSITFGTGTDPADTFTTADTNFLYASQIVPMMWRVPDNIYIDSVTSLQGSDAATGDTVRFHLKSYTFNSASTSCLTAGTLLAHSDDQVDAGNEQAYLNTWNIDSASVAANKVILAFIRMDSVNSDISLNITVKYHLV
tara:strand:- start:3460 stop:4248 length:789 start_codon:yes stop_codon:yes gene_type:complete